MKASNLISAVLVSTLVPTLGTTLVMAQPQESPDTTTDTGFDHAVPAVNHAFELGVSTGYQQGAGKLGGNMGSLEDVAGPGGAIELDASYRIIPELSVGLYGTYAQNATGDRIANNTDVLGATAGVQATFHARPDRSVDPWVSLGSGWKGLWLNPDRGKVTSLQGFELARLQVGADYRVSKDISISPVIGGSLSMFVSEDSPMTDSYTEIQDKKVNFTGFAGLSGRFDLGGTRGR